ncbi:MAG: TetR/AcrR family transcriptional regulator [Solibacillus sp.]|uniref:TetR/AcrR family transcriptional regulator n=1 Tax=Solibacillus sp. TaxID=1909654 RepID=UPI003315164D
MTQQKIVLAAYSNFAEHGYSGGSLAQIAEEVGIRKQSIYTYFKSKDDLYLSISQDAMQTELAFMKGFIEQQQEQEVEQMLYLLLRAAQQRFLQQLSTKFFIRSTFITPPHLEKQLLEQTYFYLDSLEAILKHFFAKQQIAVSPTIAASSFLALLDSLYVEMLYGGEARFEKRLEAGWKVFYRGITN